MRLEAAAKTDGVTVSGFLRRMLYHNLGIGEDYLSSSDWIEKEFRWLTDEKIKALKKAFMLDLISFNQNKEVTINLVGSCIKEAKKRNCDIIEFRGFNQSIRSNINFFNPFVKKIKDNPFYYKSNNIKLKKCLNKYIYLGSVMLKINSMNAIGRSKTTPLPCSS